MYGHGYQPSVHQTGTPDSAQDKSSLRMTVHTQMHTHLMLYILSLFRIFLTEDVKLFTDEVSSSMAGDATREDVAD